MSRHLFFIVSTFFILFDSFGQEMLLNLEFNPNIYYKSHSFKTATSTSNNINYISDTLSLPFIDDFSKNTLSDITNTTQILATGLCFDQDTTRYMFTTSWTYSYNMNTKKIDSSANSSIQLIFFDDSNNCSQATDTQNYFPVYYNNYTFDTLTGIATDSNLVSADTLLLTQLINIKLLSKQEKWLDNFAFINSTYPVNPITIGVATFDGLNEYGLPYGTVQSSVLTDKLTSKPINLSGLTVADSVYLSFYYEAGGLGDEPNIEDSLLIDFKDKNENWETVWQIPGPNIIQTTFSSVLLNIIDTNYFHKSFQFRFKNYATQTGNNDHWHIDYVRLDSARNINDTIIDDLAFIFNASSMLASYEAMPWNQFKGFESTELGTNHIINLRNNFTNSKNAKYNYSTVEVIGSTNVFTEPLDSTIIPALTNSSITYIPPPIPVFSGDSVLLETTYALSTSGDINSANDSVVKQQTFYNYYAYDDGSAEKVYALFGAGVQFATKFTANITDTIRAIQIHFAHANRNVGTTLFSLAVWQSIDETNSGTGDNMIYSEVLLRKPEVSDSSVNGFTTYVLRTPVIISGTFYVGWIQANSDLMEVGFDVNTNHKQNIFYNPASTWQNTSFNGSVMIRPVLGKNLAIFSGVNTFNEKPFINNRIYPNPVHDILYFENKNNSLMHIEIFNINGKKLIESENIHNFIDTSLLPEGLYVIKATSKSTNKATFVSKFIKINN